MSIVKDFVYIRRIWLRWNSFLQRLFMSLSISGFEKNLWKFWKSVEQFLLKKLNYIQQISTYQIIATVIVGTLKWAILIILTWAQFQFEFILWNFKVLQIL